MKAYNNPIAIQSNPVHETGPQRDPQTNTDPETVPDPKTVTPAKIPRGVAMLSTPVVYKRRGKKRSAHYEDIKNGLFIEPVAIGLRSRATPDYEVDVLIAARIVGNSDEQIRAIVRKLRAARKGNHKRSRTVNKARKSTTHEEK